MKNDPYKSKWKSMSRFEKLCWAWITMNQYAIDKISKNPNSNLFKFEDIFNSDNRYDNLRELIDFATSFPDGKKIAYGSLEGTLEKKININPSYEFPSWKKWSSNNLKRFKNICEPLMNKLEYGNEKDYRLRI